jgi:uncharacterized SAM-binding protein YcdF (DUF218 family)
MVCVYVILIFIVGLEFKTMSKNMWNYLIVNENPKPADVIIVLVGDTGRIQEGVRLYQLGYANKILITAVGAGMIAEQAQSLGVARDDIIWEEKAWTTFGEAKYSSEVMGANGFRSAIVVTSPYHTRRASIIFGQLFKGWNITICSVPYDSSAPSNWWKNPQTATAVISEYLKLGLHYLLPKWV